jgi:hypothetical protein
MIERDLSQIEVAELEQLIADGVEVLSDVVELPPNLDDPDAVVKSIRRFVDAVRATEPENAEHLAYAVGALWGDELHRTLDWPWVVLDDGNTALLGLVSADRAIAVRPQLFVYRLLVQREADNTAALLFNMLCEGQRPPGAPGSYTAVG